MRKIMTILASGLLASGCSTLTPTTPIEQPYQLQLEQKYIVEWIGQRPLIDRSHLSLKLGLDQRASGFAGCNNWFASYHLNGEQLSFGQLATTRKICAASLMEQEQQYLEALSQTERWSFSGEGQLQLWPAHGAPTRLWPEHSPASN